MEVKEVPYPAPGPNEVVIKVQAIAINPIDWKIQSMGDDLFTFLKYPYIGGSDIAGEVVEVGPSVTTAAKGDLVVGLTMGITNSDVREGSFQHYAVLRTHMMCAIPAGLSATQAVVLPMGICTASAGLYQKDYLNLTHPSLSPAPTGKTVLIWAGSSSVGSNAIQLAVASGYEVITTASPRNFAFCKSLGASQVFDYASPTVTQELVSAFRGKTLGGALALLEGAIEVCLEVIKQAERGDRRLAIASPYDGPVPEGVSVNSIFATSVAENEVSRVVWNQFLPAALATGKYRCAPEPEVVGKGLESLQSGLDRLKAGVSGKKLVVVL